MGKLEYTSSLRQVTASRHSVLFPFCCVAEHTRPHNTRTMKESVVVHLLQGLRSKQFAENTTCCYLTVVSMMQAPLPLRHAGSAPMGLPTLVDHADPQLRPYTALRKALLLSLRYNLLYHCCIISLKVLVQSSIQLILFAIVACLEHAARNAVPLP